jgi:hypothetical protein
MDAPVIEDVVTTARRAQLIISGASLAVGLAGLILSRDVALTASSGEIVFGLGVSFNPLSALVTAGLSGLAVAGALLGNRSLVVAAAAGFGLAAIQVLVQFGSDTNWLGSRGSNLSFDAAAAVGLWSLVWLERQEVSRA